MEYGLIGKKLGHSFSKDIHQSIMDYQYDLVEIAPENLKEFLTEREFKAINVTVPYKQDVIPYLDEIDEKAKMIHAVNTIVNRDGKLYGYNTDFDGVVELLKHMNVSLEGKNVLILGTGGTSNTIMAVCQYLKSKQAIKVSRKEKEGCISYEEALKKVDTDIIINTTPSGMYPDNDSQAIDLKGFEKLEAVVDVVYNPLRTSLVLQAQSLKIKAEGGLYMLVAQAVKAIEHFKSISLDDSLIEQQYQKILNKKQNIVIIGMPGCGKTTISRMLGSDLKMEVIDCDRKIVEKAGCSISEIFAQQGEKGFRDIESEVVIEVSKLNGKIIATGGGAILREENVKALKQNGIVIYLMRDVEKLQVSNGRPLSRNIEDNKKRFAERKDKYEAAADYFANNNGSLGKTVKKIKEILK